MVLILPKMSHIIWEKKSKLCMDGDLRVVPGHVIPSHVICDEHHDVRRLCHDNAGHQDAEKVVGEQHVGQSGQILQLPNWPAAQLITRPALSSNGVAALSI